jgi:kinetochore protein Spc24
MKLRASPTDNLQLIHHTSGNFHIAPDKAAVSRINDSLSTLEQARNLRVREAESALKSTYLKPRLE